MPAERKKLPNEYPMFAIRLSDKQKSQITELIEEVRSVLNKRINPRTNKRWLKNDVVVESLKLGLPILKKHYNSRKG